MKAQIRHLANRFVGSLGFDLIRRNADQPRMVSALKRTAAHGFGVRSVLDIGAAAGCWSTLAMPIFPEAQFLGVEPLQERISPLKTLRSANPKFDFCLCVAGEKDGGTAELNVADDLDGSTVDGMGGIIRQVPIRTIDALVVEKKLDGPFLIKFDTHGYELPILRGATESLQRTAVIVMEVYNFQFVPQAQRFHEMCSHMEELGFRPFDLANPTYRQHDRTFWQMDLFFARAEHAIFQKSSYR